MVKNWFIIAWYVCAMQGLIVPMVLGRNFSAVERDVQKNMQAFNELSRSINISDISQSIVSNDAQALKGALRDVMDLNQMVNSQVHAVTQLWNMYLDSVKIPSMETYLLGQVMNSLITTLRALTLRCSVDQSMILSLVKKYSYEDSRAGYDFGQAIDVRDSWIENRWKSLRITD